MISNGLFEETNEQCIFCKICIINCVLNFTYIMFHENPSMKNLSLREIYNNKAKMKKNYDFMHTINSIHKFTSMCTSGNSTFAE